MTNIETKLIAASKMHLERVEARTVFNLSVKVALGIVQGQVDEERLERIAIRLAELETKRVVSASGEPVFWAGSKSGFAKRRTFESSKDFAEFDVELTY